jgi:CheY-like chemotaxis protein
MNFQNAEKLESTTESQSQGEEPRRWEDVDPLAVNRAKDEFLATLSHELRTPLNSILGWSRMLRSGLLPPEKTSQALETIERNATIQMQLVEDLLDVSRIVAGKLTLDLRAVDLTEVVENAIAAVRTVATEKGVELRADAPAMRPMLGDPDRLQQVIWNLLANAVRFTPAGGTVEVFVRRVAATIEIVVADSGQGIAPEFLPHIFERFRQADGTSSRTHGGLGLGLAIAQSIAELHGGSLIAESEGIGRGATFTVRLPITNAPTSDRPREPSLRPLPSPLPVADEEFWIGLEGVHVVVVDDEPDARELVSDMLTTSSHATVRTCASVGEALEAIRERRPDILVSDLGMPGENGYDLITKLRALPAAEGGNIPAVALTAYARVEDRKRALDAGFNVHVPKPVERTELLTVLSNLRPMFSVGQRTR